MAHKKWVDWDWFKLYGMKTQVPAPYKSCIFKALIRHWYATDTTNTVNLTAEHSELRWPRSSQRWGLPRSTARRRWRLAWGEPPARGTRQGQRVDPRRFGSGTSWRLCRILETSLKKRLRQKMEITENAEIIKWNLIDYNKKVKTKYFKAMSVSSMRKWKPNAKVVFSFKILRSWKKNQSFVTFHLQRRERKLSRQKFSLQVGSLSIF